MMKPPRHYLHGARKPRPTFDTTQSAPNLLNVPQEMRDMQDDAANAAANKNAAAQGLPPIDLVAETQKLMEALPALAKYYEYAAKRMLVKYKALKAAGFDEQQALYLSAQKD